MPGKQIQTSRELAEIAGVSHMTVARAFRPNAEISAKTRERILRLAKEHGYHPNPIHGMLAQAIQQRESGQLLGTLAFVHHGPGAHTWEELPHQIPYLKGIRQRARELGFNVDLFQLNEKGMKPGRLSDILQARGIHGVIMAPPPSNVHQLHFDWDNFSCVTFHHDTWQPLLHRVANDEVDKMAVTLKKVKELGYRRPGLALTYYLDLNSHYALSGIILAQQDVLGEKDAVPPLRYKGPAFIDSIQEISAWIHQHQPDCIICEDGSALSVLQEAGWKVPKDMGLVHMGIGPDVDDWTGYRLLPEAIGAAVVDVLANRLVHNELGVPKESQELLIRGHWQPGKTTRPQV